MEMQKMNNKNYVKNYYQGIYLTETILGNPNGDFLDNSPRNFDGIVFTTDKCIKYNIRKYIHDFKENLDKKENIVFFFPRLIEDAKKDEAKFRTRGGVFKFLDPNTNFNELKNNSPDIRMFGGTFTFTNNDKDKNKDKIPSKQIYGPIQLSYGIDINDAKIKKLQIGSPFANESGNQTSPGAEYVVDDAIISYDITINPNNHDNLLLTQDLDLFKESLWHGTNLRKSTSKKTDSKLLMLIKFKNKNDSNNKVSAINIGEIKELIEVNNKKERKLGSGIIELSCEKLKNKLEKYKDYIECIEVYYDKNEVNLCNFINETNNDDNNEIKVYHYDPVKLLHIKSEE